jgi:uncharacterized protein (DUF427 family)
MWSYRGQKRPPYAIEPEPGQESVWDYPRPPDLRPDQRLVEVLADGRTIVRSSRAVRVCETASPPTFYVPPADVQWDALVSVAGNSYCEWKGSAVYWALAAEPGKPVAWSYPKPKRAFRSLRDYLSFYPGRVECRVDGVRVEAQAGGFYGGWITPDIVGPFKGDPGTGGW